LDGKHNELIAKEGWIFAVPLVALTLLAILFVKSILLIVILAALSTFTVYFFRNPYRQIPEHADVVVSPADGKVVAIRRLEDGRHLISIFLNVFNVHVNRSPIAGKIREIQYTPGRFLPASREEASSANERNKLVIEDGTYQIEVTQIAGLIARRIVCWVKDGQTLNKGQRIGLIRFGSRMDIVLPAESRILVSLGQKVAGGTQVIAERQS
jgi:phosphatidylserine decarboxylase